MATKTILAPKAKGKNRSTLTDHEVDLLRELVEELIAGGMKPMQAYRSAAEKFERHAAKLAL